MADIHGEILRSLCRHDGCADIVADASDIASVTQFNVLVKARESRSAANIIAKERI